MLTSFSDDQLRSVLSATRHDRLRGGDSGSDVLHYALCERRVVWFVP